MIFDNVKSIVIPEGSVKEITCNNVTLWQKIRTIIETVSGVGTIVLQNVIRLVGITQYGKCEQASTPTPSVPVDIKCNNGAIKTKHHSGLPLGYQKLDYVVGIVNQTVVNTGVRGDLANLRIVFRGKKTTHTAYSPFFGNYRDENTNVTRVIEGSNWSNPILYTYNRKAGGGSAAATGIFSEDAHTYDLSSSGLVVDGDKFFEIRDVSGTSNSTNIAICASSVPSSAASSGASTVFAYFKIYQGETLIRDYVPVKRLSDNKVGFYELVNNTFEQGLFSSSYAFTAGSTADDPVEIYTDSTPEVLTVSGANLLDPTTVSDNNIFISRTNGNEVAPSSTGGVFRHSDYIPIVSGETYYFGITPFQASIAGLAWYNGSNYVSGMNGTALENADMKATAPNDATHIRFSWRIDEGYDTDWEHSVYFCINGAMNRFAPYSVQTTSVENLFKIAANNYYTDYTDEQNIISGIVTRKVGVKVFNGTEDWGLSSPVHTLKISDAVTTELRKTPLLCTHYPIIDDGRSFNDTPNDTMFFTSGKNLGIKDSTKTTAQMKTWLATQYANGTPVIILYPLAESTEESVTPQSFTVSETAIISAESDYVDNIALSGTYETPEA